MSITPTTIYIIIISNLLNKKKIYFHKSYKYKEEDFVVILEDKHVKTVKYTKKPEKVIGKIIAVYKKF